MRWDATAYDLIGPEEAEPLVLIHGLGLNRNIWRALLPDLAERHRVLLYDLDGHGQSGPTRETASLSRYAEQLGGLMDHVGMGPATIIGFSLGGMINRKLTMVAPERVRALVILNSPHTRTPEAQRQAEAYADQSAEGGPAATIDAALARWFTREFVAQHRDIIDEVRDWVLSCDPQSYADARSVLAHGVKGLIAPEPPITCPTLIATSENDTGSTPDMARAMHREMPHATLQIVPGLKHLGLLERPGIFKDLILEFLNAVKNDSAPSPRTGAAE